MNAHVISHPGAARKRGLRAALLAATALGVIALAGWLAWIAVDSSFRDAPDAPPPAPETLVILPPAAAPEDAAPAPAETAPPARRTRRSIPLDAAPAATEPDGYEVLSAAELDAISQDRATPP